MLQMMKNLIGTNNTMLENIQIIRIDLEGIQGLAVAVQGDRILVPEYRLGGRVNSDDMTRYEIAIKVTDKLTDEVWANYTQYPNLYSLAADMRQASKIRRVFFIDEI